MTNKLADWVCGHPVTVLLLVGLPVPVLLAATQFEWRDVATLFGPTSAKYDICWQQTNAPPIEWVEFRRTRIEGGAPEVSPRYPRSQWHASGKPNEYCLLEQQLPMSGHFVYEIKACHTATGKELCSPWLTSLNAANATVEGKQRAWWIYGFLPPAGAPEISTPQWITDPNKREVVANVKDR